MLDTEYREMTRHLVTAHSQSLMRVVFEDGVDETTPKILEVLLRYGLGPETAELELDTAMRNSEDANEVFVLLLALVEKYTSGRGLLEVGVGHDNGCPSPHRKRLQVRGAYGHQRKHSRLYTSNDDWDVDS